MYCLGEDVAWPPGVVTFTTTTTPFLEPGGALHVIFLSDLVIGFTIFFPKITFVVLIKFVPVIFTSLLLHCYFIDHITWSTSWAN